MKVVKVEVVQYHSSCRSMSDLAVTSILPIIAWEYLESSHLIVLRRSCLAPTDYDYVSNGSIRKDSPQEERRSFRFEKIE